MAELKFRFRIQSADQPAWFHDLPADQPTVIGRAAHCDLVLDDEARLVSKEHARIERREGEWLVEDLESKNRTRVNDIPLKIGHMYPISAGDRVTVGGFELVLEAPDLEDVDDKNDDDDPTVVDDEDEVHVPTEPVDVDVLLDESDLTSDRVRFLLKALSRTTAQLISIPDQFRQEFFGMTIPGESLYHLARDPDRLLRRLVDPDIPDEQFESLIAQIEEAVRRVINHQLAMLEGYRSCVKEHVSIVEDRLDPDRFRERARKEGSFAAQLPLLIDREVVKLLEDEHRQQAAEDWSAIEQAVFRKVFRDAYLARSS